MTPQTPDNWFEDVYAASDDAGSGVPWARMAPGAELVAWLDVNLPCGDGRTRATVHDQRPEEPPP